MIALTRRPDWRARFSAYVEAQRRAPPETQRDCALITAGAIEAMTGVDLAAQFRGRYCNYAEGLSALRAEGFADVCAYLASLLTEIKPVRAGIGDIMAIPAPETGWSLGICNGERIAVLLSDGSYGTTAREHATRAFRVPA